MASLTTAVDTDFTPAAGPFIARASGGSVELLRKNSSGDAAFASVGVIDRQAVVIDNPVAGAVYRFTGKSATAVTVAADQ